MFSESYKDNSAEIKRDLYESQDFKHLVSWASSSHYRRFLPQDPERRLKKIFQIISDFIDIHRCLPSKPELHLLLTYQKGKGKSHISDEPEGEKKGGIRIRNRRTSRSRFVKSANSYIYWRERISNDEDNEG